MGGRKALLKERYKKSLNVSYKLYKRDCNHLGVDGDGSTESVAKKKKKAFDHT